MKRTIENSESRAMDHRLLQKIIDAEASDRAVELSIVIPFHNDDPLPLAEALKEQIDRSAARVEIIVFDDGSHDEQAQFVRRGIDNIPVARLVASAHNLGRAGARNALAREAHGRWCLFLDADMFPPPGFVDRHVSAIREGGFDAAFCGYRPLDGERGDLTLLHGALVAVGESAPAAEREARGPTAFCTGNLLVRTSLMSDVPFDREYTGWGWEDVDWALRAAKDHRLVHLDNPIVRLASDAPDVLLEKYKSAARNYARLLMRHPEVASLPGGRVARLMKRIFGQRHLRPVWIKMVQEHRVPLRLRILALKLWRASWAAEALPG